MEGEVRVSCRKCRIEMPSGQLDNHLNNECEQRVVPCEFRNFGCKFESATEKMHEHAQEHVHSHLLLLSKHIPATTTQDNESKRQTSSTCAMYTLGIIIAVLFFLCICLFVCSYHQKSLISNLERELEEVKQRIQTSSEFFSEREEHIQKNIQKATDKLAEHDRCIQTIQNQLQSTIQPSMSSLNTRLNTQRKELLRGFHNTSKSYKEMKEKMSSIELVMINGKNEVQAKLKSFIEASGEKFTKISRKVASSESAIGTIQHDLKDKHTSLIQLTHDTRTSKVAFEDKIQQLQKKIVSMKVDIKNIKLDLADLNKGYYEWFISFMPTSWFSSDKSSPADSYCPGPIKLRTAPAIENET